jgi:predicted transcriptional regulator
MLHSVMNVLFRCGHQHTTFPITPRRRPAGSVTDSLGGTYVACLDCGKQFAYDWKSMRIGDQMAPTPATREPQMSIH